MEIDLHGYELWDAIEEMCYRLEECNIKGIREIAIIHGYQHGQVLKHYFRSEGFLKDMFKEGFKLRGKTTTDQGVSYFEIIY